MRLSSVCHESEAQRDVFCKRLNNQSYETAVSWQSVDRFSSSRITYDASTHSLFQLLFHPLENKQQRTSLTSEGSIFIYLQRLGWNITRRVVSLPLLSSDVDPLLSRRECVGLPPFAADRLPLRLKRAESFFIRSSIGVVVALWKMLVAISRGRSESLTGEKLEMRQTQLWEITSGGINMHAERVLCNQWIVI